MERVICKLSRASLSAQNLQVSDESGRIDFECDKGVFSSIFDRFSDRLRVYVELGVERQDCGDGYDTYLVSKPFKYMTINPLW